MDWNEALKAARAEHRELIQKRDELDAARAEIDFEVETVDKRVVQLEHTIASLSELTGANKILQRNEPIDLNNLKLADAIRKVLNSLNRYWTPIHVRNALVARNYDLTPYTNPLASIHAVLKRLIDSGEAIRTAGPDGKAMYRWKVFPSTAPVIPPSTGHQQSATETLLERFKRPKERNSLQELAEELAKKKD